MTKLKRITILLLVVNAVTYVYILIGFIRKTGEYMRYEANQVNMPDLDFLSKIIINSMGYATSFLLLVFLVFALKRIRVQKVPSKWGYFLYCFEKFLKILAHFFSMDVAISPLMKSNRSTIFPLVWSAFWMMLDLFLIVLGVLAISCIKEILEEETE